MAQKWLFMWLLWTLISQAWNGLLRHVQWYFDYILGLKWTFSETQKPKIISLECPCLWHSQWPGSITPNTGVLIFSRGVTYSEYLSWHAILIINHCPQPILGHPPILVYKLFIILHRIYWSIWSCYSMTMYHAHISAQKTCNYHLYDSLSLKRALYVTSDVYDILISFLLCCWLQCRVIRKFLRTENKWLR